jgi:hypothetical protein
MKEIIENAANEFGKNTVWSCPASFTRGAEFMQQKYEEYLRWIPVTESLPVASEDKKDWWTSDIKEVFPYSRACIVENTDGERFINQYSINENCWSTWCGEIVKWRYLEPIIK